MLKILSSTLTVFTLLVAFSASAANPQVELATNMGRITLELFPDKAPQTVDNFLQYVKEGFYDGTVFHRIIPNFMLQGGGFTPDFNQKKTRGPVKNEAANGLKNTIGTVAMARTSDPHSATAQFFINIADNDFLNFTAPTQQGHGYAVFGKVVKGMDVVEKIAKVATGPKAPHSDVPLKPVIIERAKIIETPVKSTK
ncbi:MAG: peptidylprolyl isomerase [Burkholderiales bacterium]|nr:peptidylprolyl isomerase [Burkholderiales bacterium]